MAIPSVTCSPQKAELSYSGSSQTVVAHASATNSPTSWTWTMLDVPVGGEAAKNSGDFVGGVATGPTLTDPTFDTVGGIFGSYTLQAVATNGEGPSRPDLDRENGQYTMVVKSRYRALKLPGEGEYDWKPSLDASLRVLDGPLTTKGDLLTFSTAVARLPVSATDGQLLSVAAAETTGLKWVDPPITSPLTTKGDLYTHNGTTMARLPVGITNGQLLSVNSATGTGLEWITLTTVKNLQVSYNDYTAAPAKIILDSTRKGLIIQDASPTLGSAEGLLTVLDTAGTGTYFTVKGDGKVGIGTTSPARMLHVCGAAGAAGPELLVENTSLSSNYKRFNVFLSNDCTVFRALNDAATEGKRWLAADHVTGYVGIGDFDVSVAKPASPLSVNGGISAGTYSATAAPSNGMIISGTVGVGLSNPNTNTKLVVRGSLACGLYPLVSSAAGVDLYVASQNVNLVIDGLHSSSVDCTATLSLTGRTAANVVKGVAWTVDKDGITYFKTTDLGATPAITITQAGIITFSKDIAVTGALGLYSYTAGETLAQYDVVYAANASGTLKLYKADADAESSSRVVGVVVTGAALDSPAKVVTTGVYPMYFDADPVAGDLGKPVYLSTTAGKVTITPPGAGKVLLRVGYLMSLATSTRCDVVIHIGDEFQQ